MPSPFPGMDPYLEHPDLWPEVHHWLITVIAEALVPQVRPKYRVAIKKRIYEVNDSNGDKSLLVGIPDVSVKRQPRDPDLPTSNVAVVEAKTKPAKVKIPLPEKIKQAYLEVRDMGNGRVVTAIEILSPVNKCPGEGRNNYLKKRKRILGSLTHLVEIDLLRKWQPMPTLNNDIQTDYRVLVSREETRPEADLYAFNLPETAPGFGLPLQEKDAEPEVHLQELLNQVYDRAGYDYIIDYTNSSIPPLAEKYSLWAKDILENRG